MALDDSLIGNGDFDPRAATESLIRQVSDLPPGGPVDPRALTTRLARKLGTEPPPDFSEPSAPKPRPPAAEPTAPARRKAPPPRDDAPDFSAQAAPPPLNDTSNTGLDFSAQATPPPEAEPPAPIAPSLGVTGHAAAFAKGIPAGALEGIGGVMKGVARLHNEAQPYLQSLQYDEQGNVVGQAPVQPPAPIAQHPLYRAGQTVYAAAPTMTDAEKDSIAGRVGHGLGTIAPYAAATVLGGPALGIAAGFSGMAADTYGSVYENAKKHGASDEVAASAASRSALVGGVLGSLPLGAGKYAKGLAAKMTTSSAAFATAGEAQEAILQQIAKDYDPKAGYTFDQKRLIAELILGAGMGGLHHGFERKPEEVRIDTSGDTTRPNGGIPPPGPEPAAPDGGTTGPQTGAGGPDVGTNGPRPGGSGESKGPDFTMDPQTRSKMERVYRHFEPGSDPSKMADHDLFNALNEHLRDTSSTGYTAKPETAEESGAREQAASERTERDELKRRGWADAQIDLMTPEQRRRYMATEPPEDAQSTAQAKPEAKPEQPETPIDQNRTEATSPDQNRVELATSESDVAVPTPSTRDAPMKPRTAGDVLDAQPAEPTPAQAEAENYRHSHIELDHLGLSGKNSISIETGVGGERKGTDPSGKPWSVTLEHAAYGRIKGTKGADGQPLDIFVGPHPTSPHVFVVDRHHQDGGFDEHKILAGFLTPIDALHAYANSYNDMAKDRIGHVTAMTPEEFKAWLGGDTTKALKPPASEPVKAEAGGPAVTEVAPADGTPKETPTGPGAESGGSAPTMQNPGKSSARQPTQATKSDEPTSLLQFIASKGGLAPHAELDALDIGDHRAQIPGRKGFFGVVRPAGLRHLAEGEEGAKTKRQAKLDAEREQHEQDQDEAHYGKHRAAIKAGYPDLPTDVHESAARIMADEGERDVDTAVERAAMRLVADDADYQVTESDIKDTFGEGASDEIQRRQASEDGRAATPASGQKRRSGEGEEAVADGERVPSAGAESDQGEVTAAHHKAIEDALGPDADRVAHVDIARAAELLAEHEGMDPATAFGHAVIENAVDQNFLTPQQAEAAYGKEVQDLLATGREGASGSGAHLEQGSAASGEVGTGGAEKTGELPGSRKARESEAAKAASPSEGRSDDTAAASNTTEQPAASRDKTAGDETSDTAQDRPAAETADKPVTERGPDGKDQIILPGAEKASDRKLAQRAADRPLKPRVAQRPTDHGLFGDERHQGDFLGGFNEPSQLGFYSAVEDAVDGMKQNKASPGQWMAAIRNTPGVKPEELKWLGIGDWLKEQQGSVTKDQVQDYVRANAIEVKEIKKGGDQPTQYTVSSAGGPAAEHSAPARFATQAEADAELARREASNPAGYHNIAELPAEGSNTKFPSYTLPGGENYRELLLTLPEKKQFDPAQVKIERVPLSATQANVRLFYGDKKIGTFADHQHPDEYWIDLMRRRSAGDRSLGVGPLDEGANFRTSHWDEPNVLAHIRFDDRISDGKKTLHVAEVQSDWHQAGKRKGYREDQEQRLADLVKQRDDMIARNPEKVDELNVLHDQIRELGVSDPGVPDAPFKTTWPELSMKRMIRYAAEHGYDRISWDTGATNAERYDLSKQIKVVRFDKFGSSGSTPHAAIDSDTRGMLTAFDHNGEQVLERHVEVSELPDIIGKDAAEKLLAAEAKRSVSSGTAMVRRKIEGLDLKVGGEGMAGFYDRILPATVNKLVKKFGAKVEESAVVADKGGWHITPPDQTVSGKWMVKSSDYNSKGLQFDTEAEARKELAELIGTVQVHALDITPELRAAAINMGFALHEQSAGRPSEPRTITKIESGRGAAGQAHVLEQGRNSGNEHLIAYDAKGKEVYRTAGKSTRVEISGAFQKELMDPANDVVIHHNHPSGTTLSGPDIAMLGLPGLRAVWAHGHDGNVYRGSLTTRANKSLPFDIKTRVEKLQAIMNMIDQRLYGPIQDAVNLRLVTPEQANRDLHELRNRAMHDAGIIDYRSNTDMGDFVSRVPHLDEHISSARTTAQKWAFNEQRPPSHRPDDRRSEPLRHAGDLGATFERGRIAARIRDEARPHPPDKAPARNEAPKDKGVGGDQLRLLEGASAFEQPNNLFKRAGSLDNSIDDILGKRLLGRFGDLNATEARTQLQDKFLRVQKVEQALDAPSDLSAHQAESLYYGKTGYRLEQLNEHHIDPIIREMKARDIDLEKMDDFLYARHAVERNNKIGKMYPPDHDFHKAMNDPDIVGGSGMSKKQAQDILNGVGSNRLADYKAVAAIVDALNYKTRRTLFDAGLINRDTFDSMNSTYKYYVPLRGMADGSEHEESIAQGSGMNIRGKETKQAFGRKSEASSPLAYSIMQAELAIVRAEKNKVGQTFLQLVRANPDSKRWTIDRPELVKRIDKNTGLVTSIPNNLSLQADNVFSTKVDGKTVNISLHGVDGLNLARALKSMGTANVHSLVRAYSAVTHTMAKLATSWNPEFMIPNFARDMGEAFINLQEQGQKDFVKNFARHILPALRGSMQALGGKTTGRYVEAFIRFDKAGGRVRFFGIDDPDRIEGDVNRKLKRLQNSPVNTLRDIGDNAAKALEVAGGGIENATRLAAFMAAEDAGMSQADAAAIARNLTVNFNKKGELGGVLSALYMFSNAGIQGQARMAKALGNRRVQIAVGVLAAAAALAALYSIGAGGDDGAGKSNYIQIEPWVRDKNLIFMLKDGYYLKVPLPYGFAPFAVTAARAVGVLMGKESPGVAAAAIINSIVNAFNPLGEEGSLLMDIWPSALRPLAHIENNKSWTGKSLYPDNQFSKGRPDASQYFKSDSAFSKEAAKKLNEWSGGNAYSSGNIDVHPGTLDHLLQSYTGGVGRFGKGVVDTVISGYKDKEWNPEKTPIIRRFIGRIGPEADNAAYRELRDAEKTRQTNVTQARKDLRGGVADSGADKFIESSPNTQASIFKAADNQMRRLRKKEAEIEISAKPYEERRDAIKAVREEMRAVQNEARKRVYQLKNTNESLQGAP